MVKRFGRRVKEGFRRIWSPSQILFAIFLEAWVLSITIIVTIRTVTDGGVAVTYFWIVSYVLIVFALLTLIRMKMEPKDKTTFKEIKDGIDKLIEMHTPPKERDIGLVNHQIKDDLKKMSDKDKTNNDM